VRTKDLHPGLVHICLGNADSHIRLTLPALLGSDRAIAIIERCHDEARNALNGSTYRKDGAQQCADRWPEYVLGSDNPLTFLDPGMECTFFAA
jgi:hypothetical protein